MVHLGLPDPASAEGGDAAKMQIFQQVRDAIRKEILIFLAEWDKLAQTRPLEFMAELT